MNDTMLKVDAGVRRTIAAYARHVDGRDMDQCASLFAPEARIAVMGESHEGAVAIRAWLNQLARSAPGIHLTTNTLVEMIGEGRASAVSDVAFIKRDDSGWRIVVAGQYADELVESDGRWLFANRTITLS